MRRLYNFRNFVNERKRAQLELPFDNKHPMHGKPHHVHIMDALEDLNKMDADKYRSSVTDLDPLFDKNIEAATKMLEENWEHDMSGFLYDFAWQYSDQDDFWTEDMHKLVKDDLEVANDHERAEIYSDAIKDEYADFKDAMTDTGKEAWDSWLKDKVVEEIDTMKWVVSESFDDNGLIEVWRAINFSKKTDVGNFRDVYNAIVKGYKGIGVYWSWDENSAEAHWGATDTSAKGFVMHAEIRPEDIDWKETIYKNAYSLKEESEITLKDQAMIKVNGMTTKDSNGKDTYVEFHTPYIIPA